MNDPKEMPVLPAEVWAALKEWHDSIGFACVAHSEGQNCCVDELLAAEGPST